jgi:hypothetical protein
VVLLEVLLRFAISSSVGHLTTTPATRSVFLPLEKQTACSWTLRLVRGFSALFFALSTVKSTITDPVEAFASELPVDEPVDASGFEFIFVEAVGAADFPAALTPD